MSLREKIEKEKMLCPYQRKEAGSLYDHYFCKLYSHPAVYDLSPCTSYDISICPLIKEKEIIKDVEKTDIRKRPWWAVILRRSE